MPSSATRAPHSHHLGSSRLLTNWYGYPVGQSTFLPYGYEVNPQLTTNTYKFTGLERDAETGPGNELDHAFFRQYSPRLGRWMSPDPAGLAAVDMSNPQTWNRYAYVGGNPMNFIDPLGLKMNLACPMGVCSGGGGPTYIVDGVEMPSFMNGFFDHLMELGIAATCPSNDCNQIRQGPDGQWQIWHPGSLSTQGNTVTKTIGGWETIPRVPLSSTSIFNSIGSRLGSVLDQLRRSPWSLSGVIPAAPVPGVYGVGPAYSVTYIPSSKTLCAGIGFGASVGRDASLSVAAFGTGNWPNNAKAISGGWSISAGATAPNGIGAQGSWSPGNGATLGPSLGVPGVSGSVAWSSCVDF